MKEYKGQSLAIVLVLLIVGSIIGFALYARFVRESERIVDEKASTEANELTEAVIGLISTSDYDLIKGDDALEFFGCAHDDLYTLDGCRVSELTLPGVNDYFSRIGLAEVDFSAFGFEFGDDFCISELAMRYGLADDEITIPQDDTYSVFLNKVDWDNCSIDFVMTGDGDSSGFTMSTFYGTHVAEELTSYKSYDFNDILGFSYGTLGDNWIPYNSGLEVLGFPSGYLVSKEGYGIDEVRFKSLGGSSNLRWEVSGNGCVIDDYLRMEVGATCDGKYVGKNFIIPGEVFSPSLLDYVLFNGTGPLVPEKITR